MQKIDSFSGAHSYQHWLILQKNISMNTSLMIYGHKILDERVGHGEELYKIYKVCKPVIKHYKNETQSNTESQQVWIKEKLSLNFWETKAQ